jgi:hypothetical protein
MEDWFSLPTGSDDTMVPITAETLKVDKHVTVGDGLRSFGSFLARQPAS